jgi:hypothetical protein
VVADDEIEFVGRRGERDRRLEHDVTCAAAIGFLLCERQHDRRAIDRRQRAGPVG